MLPTFSSLVTCFSLMLYSFLTFNVIHARHKFNIPAPAIGGNPDFERIFRAHQNTAEQMLLFLPSLWLATLNGPANVSGFIGLIWVAGRALYAYDYCLEASRRKYGYKISVTCSLLLLMIGLVGSLVKLVS